MDIAVKGRGIRLTPRDREMVQEKLAKLPRVNSRILRTEVEVIQERNPRIERDRRVEVVAEAPRKTFRAQGAGPTVEAALDEAVERLARQMREYHRRKRRAVVHGADRLKSTASRRRRGSRR